MASHSSSLLVSRPPHAVSSSQSPFFPPRTPRSAPNPPRSACAKPARLTVPRVGCRLSPARPAAANESTSAGSRSASRNRWQRRDVSRAGIFRGWRAPPAESPIGAERLDRNAPEGAGGVSAQGEIDRAGGEDADGEKSEARGEMGRSIADFLRLHEDEAAQRVELQTAVLSYRRPARWWNALRPPLQVDLVSVVHIADQDYYDALQAELATYDRVLYEMVADKQRASAASAAAASIGAAARAAGGDGGADDAERRDSRWRRFVGRKESDRWMPPKRNPKRRRRGVVGTIQSGMSAMLRLSFQLDRMDYRRHNFYHADLDLATFMQLQEERGESMFSFAREVALRSTKAIVRATAARPLAPNLGPLRRSLLWAARFVPMPLVGLLVIEGVCAPEGPGSSNLVKGAEFQALLNLDLSAALKVVLARQITLDTLDGAAGVMASSVIIGERNRACMQQVHEAVRVGSRRIAVFYGSGHLPDMHLRLTSELGLEPCDLSWRTAWSIPTPSFAPPAAADTAGSAASAALDSASASVSAAAGETAASLDASASQLRLPFLSRPASHRPSSMPTPSPSLTTPALTSNTSNSTTFTAPSSPSSPSTSSRSTPLPPHLARLSAKASSILDGSLKGMAEATGWPMTRQQTAALLLLSVVLALDLCLWEVVLGSLKDGAVVLLAGVGQFLDQGWGL
ncbi:hypothetical protein CLOM_g11881 [Closterium sp. NIES-68]|nr:hypothetical protein CLOM_g11881 [Closterium sp. NIES-68]GJP69994.1 hypothetical protein CLOP_g984 [Closterium sp. NIES-67]